MGEIKVNYASLEAKIAKLSALKKRIEFYTIKKNRLEESKGDTRDGLMEVDDAFTVFASRLEEYIDKTIENVNYIKEEFKQTDDELSSKFH